MRQHPRAQNKERTWPRILKRQSLRRAALTPCCGKLQFPPIVSTPVTPEFTNWRDEQLAWRRTAVLFDQCHHMADLNIKGPDALKLIRDTAVNSVEYFPVDAAKQYVAVSEEGYLIGDNILRNEEDEFQAVGVPPTINWLQYHAETGGYDVELWVRHPSTRVRATPSSTATRCRGPGQLT